MMRRILGLVGALALAACGSIDESEPKPRLEALSAPGTDYGSTLVGTRKQLDFMLRNSDSGFAKVKPLDVTAVAVGGNGVTFSSTCPAVPFTLDEGESCFFSVYWQPAAAGRLTGELRVTSVSAQSPQVLALTGTAVSALDPAAGVVAFVGTPDGNFGSVSRGDSRSVTYVVRNIGNADDALTVSGPTQTGWTFSEDCPDTLTAGSSCNITVVFTPDTAGVSFPSALLITDAYNANYGGLSLSLVGTGL
jgi:hypothetical protein